MMRHVPKDEKEAEARKPNIRVHSLLVNTKTTLDDRYKDNGDRVILILHDDLCLDIEVDNIFGPRTL